jgi:hypothetical protein
MPAADAPDKTPVTSIWPRHEAGARPPCTALVQCLLRVRTRADRGGVRHARAGLREAGPATGQGEGSPE